MSPDPGDARGIASRLPDAPRWVETRAMLLADRCALVPLGDAVLVRHARLPLDALIGTPLAGALVEAADPKRELIVQTEDVETVAAGLPGWRGHEAVLHVQPDGATLPDTGDPNVRLVTPSDIGGLPATLRAELATTLTWAPCAALFVDGLPVSLCSAPSETETLWDVSIDTLEPFRGRGYARRCAGFMIALEARRGRRPVWGALTTNAASLALAARLGFVAAERLFVFTARSADDR